MNQESGTVVVEFANNIYEMERILSSVRRRGFELMSLNVDSATELTGNLKASFVLRNLDSGSDSFDDLRKQLNKHIDVLAVEVI